MKVGRAWSIKEMFSGLWEYRYEKAARRFFKQWFWWATHARLKPMAEVAKKLKRHLDNILTYLVTEVFSTNGTNRMKPWPTSATVYLRNDLTRLAALPAES